MGTAVRKRSDEIRRWAKSDWPQGGEKARIWAWARAVSVASWWRRLVVGDDGRRGGSRSRQAWADPASWSFTGDGSGRGGGRGGASRLDSDPANDDVFSLFLCWFLNVILLFLQYSSVLLCLSLVWICKITSSCRDCCRVEHLLHQSPVQDSTLLVVEFYLTRLEVEIPHGGSSIISSWIFPIYYLNTQQEIKYRKRIISIMGIVPQSLVGDLILVVFGIGISCLYGAICDTSLLRFKDLYTPLTCFRVLYLYLLMFEFLSVRDIVQFKV